MNASTNNLLAIILVGSIREWVKLLTGRKVSTLHESPYVALPEGDAA